MRARGLSLIASACAVLFVACHRAPEEVAPPTTADSAAMPLSSAVAVSDRKPSRCPQDPEPNLKPLPTTALEIKDSESGPLTIEAEIARGDHDTERGLMYRTEMPEMHGMIFELERDDHAFWMHNTCISLDLLYVDKGQIVGIVESAPTLDDQPRRVGKPSDEVLELNAGFCRRHGVMVGQHVTRVPAGGRAG
jgi:uncharacterized membrane protein (UPF0127 family)